MKRFITLLIMFIFRVITAETVYISIGILIIPWPTSLIFMAMSSIANLIMDVILPVKDGMTVLV